MSRPPRHPIDQLSILCGKRCLICSVAYSAVLAAFTWADYSSLTPGTAADFHAVIGVFGTTVLLLCGIVYLIFGYSRRMRLRHAGLIHVHFWSANCALVLGIGWQLVFVLQNAAPPAAARTNPIALSAAAGGIFVFNVWRSLQSVPARTEFEPVRERRLRSR